MPFVGVSLRRHNRRNLTFKIIARQHKNENHRNRYYDERREESMFAKEKNKADCGDRKADSS
jgi:hypothetical protein